MLEKRAWAQKRLDHLRKALILEPRGHTDMYGALLTEPVTPRCARRHPVHAQRRLEHDVRPRHHRRHDDGDRALADLMRKARREANGAKPPTIGDSLRHAGRSGAGARAPGASRRRRCASNRSRSGTSRRSCSSRRCMVTVGGRKIPVDVAFGGAFYAIVDAEAAGVPIDAAHLPELRKLGMLIAREVETAAPRRPSERRRPRRHLRHDLHRAGASARCAPAQRHDLRGCRSRSIALRHWHRGGDGGAQRHGIAAGRRAVRAREHRRHDLHGPRARAGRKWERSRRSSPRSKGPPGSPASTPS